MNLTKAEMIVERASNTGKRLAVFLLAGKTKTTTTTTDLFKAAMQKHENALVGVYDGDADPRWSVEDVDYCMGIMKCAA